MRHEGVGVFSKSLSDFGSEFAPQVHPMTLLAFFCAVGACYFKAKFHIAGPASWFVCLYVQDLQVTVFVGSYLTVFNNSFFKCITNQLS